jgi:hypothetical protein
MKERQDEGALCDAAGTLSPMKAAPRGAAEILTAMKAARPGESGSPRRKRLAAMKRLPPPRFSSVN